jgi:hypothetical protein
MRVSGSLTSVIDFMSSHFVVQVPSTDGTDKTTGDAAAEWRVTSMHEKR